MGSSQSVAANPQRFREMAAVRGTGSAHEKRFSSASVQELLEGSHLCRVVFPFARWDLEAIKTLFGSLKKMGTFVMVQAQFCAWVSSVMKDLSEPEILRLFRLMDANENGRVNCLEFLAGVVMLSSEDFAGKTQFCFELYDLNLNGMLCRPELVLMVRSTVLGTLKLVELRNKEFFGEFDEDKIFEEIADQAMQVYDRDFNRNLSFREFVSWARGNRNVMTFVEVIERFALAAAQEVKLQQVAKRERDRKWTDPCQILPHHELIVSQTKSVVVEEEEDEETKAVEDFDSSTPFLLNNKESPSVIDAHLDVEWVYGYAGQRGKGTAKYLTLQRDRIVYAVGSAAVIRDTKTKKQSIYAGHGNDIVNLDVDPTRSFVATADGSGEVHVWKADNRSEGPTTILQAAPGFVQVAFSRTGQYLAIGNNKSENDWTMSKRTWADRGKHTVVDIWDWQSKKRVGDPVYVPHDYITDLCWSSEDELLAVCGAGFLKYVHIGITSKVNSYSQRRNSRDSIGETLAVSDLDLSSSNLPPPSQTFSCVSFLGKNLAVGTARGDLLLFDHASLKLEKVIKGHQDGEAVTMLSEWKYGLVSAADNGELRLWDMGLHPLDSMATVYPKKSDRRNSIALVSQRGALSLHETRITSLDITDETKSKIALVGMSSGDLFEINLAEKTIDGTRTRVPLVSGHSGARPAHIAVHPQLSAVFATCSESDCTLRIWDSEAHSLKSACLLESPGQSLAFSPDGHFLAVGLANGTVSVRDPSSKDSLEQEVCCILSPEISGKPNPKAVVISLSFSPGGKYLTLACKSGVIYLFEVWGATGTRTTIFSCVKVLKPANIRSIVLTEVKRAALDWSVDEMVLRSTLVVSESGRAHQFHWDVANGGNLLEGMSELLKEKEWDSNTFPESSLTKGLPSPFKDGARVFDVSGSILASAGPGGLLAISKFPCEPLIPSNQLKLYAVEQKRNEIGNLKFARSGKTLLCANSGLVVQWKVSIDLVPEDSRAPAHEEFEAEGGDEALPMDPLGFSDSMVDEEIEEEILALKSNPGANESMQVLRALRSELGSNYFKKNFKGRWEQNAFAPTEEHVRRKKLEQEAMGIHEQKRDPGLVLEWIQGFNAGRNNIVYLPDKSIAFPACSQVAVLLNGSQKIGAGERMRQTLLSKPSQENTATRVIAISLNRGFIAAGGVGVVYVWSTTSLNLEVKLRLPSHMASVGHLAFSMDTELLAVVGTDSNQTVAIFDWKRQRLQGSCPGGAFSIVDLAWSCEHRFTTVGLHSVLFWKCNKAEEGAPESRKGVIQKNIETSTAVCRVDRESVATAQGNGSIAIWDVQTRVVEKLIESPTASPIFTMRPTPDQSGSFFTSGKGGRITLWHRANWDRFEPIVICELDGASVKSIDVIDQGATPDVQGFYGSSSMKSIGDTRIFLVLLATSKGEMLELVVDARDPQGGGKDLLQRKRTVISTHERGETWSIAAHPTEQIACSVGHDGFLRVWDLDNHCQALALDVLGQARAVCFGPAAKDNAIAEIAVGFVNGHVKLFDLRRTPVLESTSNLTANSLSVTAESSGQISAVELKDWVDILKYSPDGKYLAIGCHDRNIYVADPHSGTIVHTLSGHTSNIRCLDWSISQQQQYYLQSNSSNAELLYWSITGNAAVQIESGKILRDIEWETWSTLYSWATSAIVTQAESSGKSLTSCCRSLGGQHIAFGDASGEILLAPFPFATPSQNLASTKRLQGHGALVTSLCFSAQDKFLVSIDINRSICIWQTEGLDRIFHATQTWKSRLEDERTFLLAQRAKKFEEKMSVQDTEKSDDMVEKIRLGKSIGDVDTKADHKLPWKVENEKWKVSEPAIEACGKSELSNFSGALELDWVYGHNPATGARYVGTQDDILFSASNVLVVQKPVRDGTIAKQNFFVGHRANVTCFDVSGDGRNVLSGDAEGRVFIWESGTTKELNSFEFQGSAQFVRFTQMSTFFCVGLASGEYLVLEVASGREVLHDQHPERSLTLKAVVASRNESRMDAKIEVAVAGTSKLRVSQFFPSSKKLQTFTYEAPNGSTFTSVSYKAEILATGHENGSVVLWNTDTGSKTIHASEDFRLNRRISVGLNDIAFLCERPGQEGLLCFNRFGGLLSLNSSLEAFEMSADEVLDHLPSAPSHADFGRALQNELLLSFLDGTILQVNLQTHARSEFTLGIASEHRRKGRTSSGLTSCTISRGGVPFAIAAGGDRLVCLWNLQEHKISRSVKLPDVATSCAVSQAGHHVAIGTKSGTLLLFNDLLRRKILEVEVAFHHGGDHERDAIRSLTFSPDDRFLAVGTDDALLRIYETRNYALVHQFGRQHSCPVTHVEWDENSNFLRSFCVVQAIPVEDVVAMIPRPTMNEISVDEIPVSKKLHEKREIKEWNWIAARGPLLKDTSALFSNESQIVPVSTTRNGIIILSSGAILGTPTQKRISMISHKGPAQAHYLQDDGIVLTCGSQDGLLLQFNLIL